MLSGILSGSGDYVLPFVPQVIPQLKYKVRSITFGTEQTRELCKYINTKYPERIHHILVPQRYRTV